MDYLRECMNDVGNPPIDVMNRNWCVVCPNRGCDRAGLNKSTFDSRVKNWKDVLFLSVPRADPADPSYDNIRSRSFSPLSPPDPAKLRVFMPGGPQGADSPAPAPSMARPAAFVRAEEEASLPTVPEVPAAPAVIPVIPVPAAPPPIPGPGNVPFEQGMVLGGGPPAREAMPQPVGDGRPAGTTFILEDD